MPLWRTPGNTTRAASSELDNKIRGLELGPSLPLPYRRLNRPPSNRFTRTGRRPVRAVRRAQALLALATGIGQQAAGQAVGLSRQAVSKVRRRYEEAG